MPAIVRHETSPRSSGTPAAPLSGRIVPLLLLPLLVLLTTAVTPAACLLDRDSERGASESTQASSRSVLHQLLDVLQQMPEEVSESGYDDETTEERQHASPPRDDYGWYMQQRLRKSGTGARPKYDPGLKWMGLGKRAGGGPAAAPIGHELFTDLRRFFDTARRGMLEPPPSVSGTPKEVVQALSLGHASGKQDRRAGAVGSGGMDAALHLETRGKEGGAAEGAPRKNYYNPSLLWTGLGRR